MRSANALQKWYGVLKKREAGILRRPERSMMRMMYGAKLMDKKNAEELIQMLGQLRLWQFQVLYGIMGIH